MMTSFAGYWLTRCQIYTADGSVGRIRDTLNDRLSPRIRVQCGYLPCNVRGASRVPILPAEATVT